MEILGADGKWTPYVNLDDVVNEPDQSHSKSRGGILSQNSRAIGGNSFGVTVVNVGEMSDLQMDDDLDHFDSETIPLYQGFSHIPGTQDLNMSTIDGEPFPLYPSNVLTFSPSMAMMQLPPQQEPSDFWVTDYRLSNHSAISPSQMSFNRLFDFQIYPHEMPCILPFKRFEDNLKAQGMQFFLRFKCSKYQFQGILNLQRQTICLTFLQEFI